ncbi:MAG: DeoR/GlpR family DNA-binding transcription regulator [Cellulomonas sp.]
MLALQRQEVILADVRARGAVRVTDLVATLDVSDMTVRRDIAELERQGLVHRVHGGAVDAHHTAHEPDFAVKRTLAGAEKGEIAQAALAWITPGASIALSAGSTAHLLAELVAADATLRPLTVVTNSLPVADTLHAASRRHGDLGLDVVLTGGVRTPSDALVGPVADASLSQLRVDRAFLGVHGLGPDGLSTPNLLEAQTDRALIASARDVVVLADHSKWGVIGLARIASLESVDVLITDGGLPDAARQVAQAAVGQLLIAPHPRTAPTTPRGAL